MSGLRKSLALLCVAGLLAGCSLFGGGPKAVKPGWSSLTVMAQEGANGDSAVAVDVVLVKDQSLVESLQALSAAKYFTARQGLQRTFPNGLTVLSLEVVPGQTVTFAPALFKDEKAWTALAFANYATPGEHRARLPFDTGDWVLRLDAQTFTVTGPVRK